jgi:hypothetical protein
MLRRHPQPARQSYPGFGGLYPAPGAHQKEVDMSDEEKTKYEKQQLELISIGKEFELKKGGYGLNVDVKNRSFEHADPLYDKSLRMAYYSELKTFCEAQRPGALFLADYTEVFRIDKPWPEYTINQIYVNGQPIKQRRQPGGMSLEGAQIIADAINNLAQAIREIKQVSPPGQPEKTHSTHPVAEPEPSQPTHSGQQMFGVATKGEPLQDLKKLAELNEVEWSFPTVAKRLDAITGARSSTLNEALNHMAGYPAESTVFHAQVKDALSWLKVGSEGQV